jgi:hypothetical protein
VVNTIRSPHPLADETKSALALLQLAKPRTQTALNVHPAVSSTSVIGLRKRVHHSGESKFTGFF